MFLKPFQKFSFMSKRPCSIYIYVGMTRGEGLVWTVDILIAV